MDDVEIESYFECRLCYNTINEDDDIPKKSTLFLWVGEERNVYVCKRCAGKLLECGEKIVGISIPKRKKLYIEKTNK